ncbi:MAG TPA: hypothetical protein VG848_06795 [Acetobacteraceae bacterium]|jgi:hypothetical protein|nr:hypothetical protein [Acetobacteraceae bacterium]
MKKNFLGVALTGLMLTAPAVFQTASAGEAWSSSPPTGTAYDSSQAYYASGYGAYAALDDQDNVHLRPASPVSRDPAVVTVPRDSTLRLVNGTGGGG